MKGYLFVRFLSVLLVFFLGMLFSKSKIELPLKSQGVVEIKIPLFSSIINRCTKLYFVKNGESLLFGEILHGPFDRPLYFSYNNDAEKFYCLYDYDISTELIVFINRKNSGIVPKQLGMIRVSSWEVKPASENDISFIMDDINKSSRHDFQLRSVPTVDIGIYKRYFSKKEMLGVLDRVPGVK